MGFINAKMAKVNCSSSNSPLCYPSKLDKDDQDQVLSH